VFQGINNGIDIGKVLLIEVMTTAFAWWPKG